MAAGQMRCRRTARNDRPLEMRAALLRFALPAIAVTGFAVGALPTRPAFAQVDPAAAGATVRLVQQDRILKTNGSYVVDVEVVLPPAADRPLEVAATLYQQVTTRTAFLQTNANAGLGSVLGALRPIDVGAAAGPETGAERDVPIRVSLPIGAASPTCPECINLSADGVYPIVIELRTASAKTVVDRFTTYLIRELLPRVDPLKFALIVPLRTAPERDASGNEQTPSTRNLIGFVEALVARPSTPLTIAPTPETLDTLARLEQQNATSSPLLNQIRGVLEGREVLDLPYVPISATLANDPRVTRVLKGDVTLGKATIHDRLGATVTSGIGIYTDRMVGSNAMTALEQDRVVIQDSALEPASDNSANARPVLIDAAAIDNSDGVPVTGVILDRGLEDHFVRKLSGRPDGADDVLRAQHLIADLAIIQGMQKPGAHGVAVLVPESTSQATLSEVLAGMEEKQIIEPVTLSNMFQLPVASSAEGTGLVRTPIISTASLPARTALQATRVLTRLDGYRSAFQAPATDADDLEKRLLVALSSIAPADTSHPSAETTAALDRIEAEANARIGTIRLSPNDVVTLTGRRQNVPIPIINDSGQPTTVVLEVLSDNVSLDGSIADPSHPGQLLIKRTIVIESRIHQEEVQVTTRGPGSFSMLLRLTTPSGLPLTNVRYTLRSTAVGGLGKILTIGALLVLGAWWIRSTVTTRRQRALLRHPATSAGNETRP
jgi:Family of unknown function (DUF6049)